MTSSLGMHKILTPRIIFHLRSSVKSGQSSSCCYSFLNHYDNTSQQRYTSSLANNNNNNKCVYDKISFVGTGSMSKAMISPLINTGIQPVDKIAIYDVNPTAMNQVFETYDGKIQKAESIPDLVDGADLIVFAVKPQNVCSVYRELNRAREIDALREDATILSIIAGKSVSSIQSGSGLKKVARSMPNTPAQIGQGVTVWCCTNNIDTDERERINKVLCSFGKSVFVEDESYIDMSTSISGSGPAYIFMLMEAMIDAGVHMGFSRNTATTLVHQTLLGSTLYAMETGLHPAILRNSVTSPAGTTASALYELENGKFRTVIKDAIWSCYRRSLEMGGSDSNVGPGRMAFPQPPRHGVALSAETTQQKSQGSSHHPVQAPAGEISDIKK